MTFLGSALGLAFAVVFVAATKAWDRQRPRWLLHGLWVTLFAYPVLFSVIDHRSVYRGADARLVGDATSTALNAAFSVFALTVCAALLLTVGPNILGGADRDRTRLCLPLVAALSMFTGCLAILALAHHSINGAVSVAVSGSVLVTLTIVGEHTTDVLTRVLWLGRTLVTASLISAVVLPSWAFVPYPYAGREFFGLGTRLIGVAPASNYLAMFAATLFFAELARPRLSHATVNWWWSGAALATCAWAQGRTAYLAVVIVALFALRPSGLRRRWDHARLALLGALAILSVVAPAVVASSFLGRDASLETLLTGRVAVWKVAIRAIHGHWALGYGPDAFGATFWRHYSTGVAGQTYANAHNQWLDVTVGYGVASTALLAVLLASLFALAWRVRTVADGPAWMALALLLSQFPFGTPLRLIGLSWNLMTAAVVLAALAGLSRAGAGAGARAKGFDSLLDGHTDDLGQTRWDDPSVEASHRQLLRGATYARLRRVRNVIVHRLLRLEGIPSTAYVHRSVSASRDLRCGEYAFVGARCRLAPGVSIGRYTMLASDVAVIGDDHVWNVPGVPVQFAGRPPQSRTKIEDDVWIGDGALVMRGVTIGRGAVVAARAVVTSDVKPYTVVAGVPARHIADRFDGIGQAQHDEMLDGPTVPPRFAGPLSTPADHDEHTGESSPRGPTHTTQWSERNAWASYVRAPRGPVTS